MIEHLFGSKTRANLLHVLFRQPEKAFFVRELTRVLDVQINAVRRELELLLRLGLIIETDFESGEKVKKAGSGLRKYYTLNQSAVLYSELQAIFIKSRLLDEQELVREMVDKAGGIQLFLFTGKFIADKRAPIDILLVGELKERCVGRLIKKYEKKFGFPIRYTIMTKKEFFERRQMMDKFLYSIFEADNIKIVNQLGV